MGNVTYDNRNGQGFGYTYDQAGRMASFAINGVVQAEYVYNQLGQQIIRRLTQQGITIHSVYGPDGNRIAEYNEATGALIRQYIWLEGAPVAVIEAGVIHFVRSDHIGRPAFATNISAAVTWRVSYLPFGGVRTTVGTPPTARFPGQWFQSETGLHQNWMRDYDPTTGRYLQADPLGLVDGASVYAYARQNPGRYVDPRGEQTSLGISLEVPAPDSSCCDGTGGGPGWGGAGAGAAIAGGIVGLIERFGGDDESVFDDDECEERRCRMASSFQLDAAGIFDPHSFKEEYVGGSLSRYDICACEDGTIVIRNRGACNRSGPTIPTYARWK